MRSNPGNYRQLRLTCTLEGNGRMAYSIYAKPLNKPWHEHQVLVRDSIRYLEPPESTEDVITLLIAVLREQLLPESHE